MSKFSKGNIGDNVTIHGRIVDTDHLSGQVLVRVSTTSGEGTFRTYEREIATHTPKPREFKPGDKVRHTDERQFLASSRFTVLCVDENAVWVKSDDGLRWTAPLDNLQHVD